MQSLPDRPWWFVRLRVILYAFLFPALTFAWLVLIEHGPESFWDGARIEWENLQSIVFSAFAKGHWPAF
ncbi:MAG TPA: hypothetical protein VGD78_08285 [Chthoniobacterales bacterium]